MIKISSCYIVIRVSPIKLTEAVFNLTHRIAVVTPRLERNDVLVFDHRYDRDRERKRAECTRTFNTFRIVPARGAIQLRGG